MFMFMLIRIRKLKLHPTMVQILQDNCQFKFYSDHSGTSFGTRLPAEYAGKVKYISEGTREKYFIH